MVNIQFSPIDCAKLRFQTATLQRIALQLMRRPSGNLDKFITIKKNEHAPNTKYRENSSIFIIFDAYRPYQESVREPFDGLG
jgi:hypothetical protein